MTTWRNIDLDALPREGTRMRLVRGAGLFTGMEAKFLCVADTIRGHYGTLQGPWVIGYVNGEKRPLIYLATAWEWEDTDEENCNV